MRGVVRVALAVAMLTGTVESVALAEQQSFFAKAIAVRDMYIISNVPRGVAAPLVWRDADSRRCKGYVSLADLGRAEGGGKGLLPYAWDRENVETIVVVDRTGLSESEAGALAKLMPIMFPEKTEAPPPSKAHIWTQTRARNSYQVLLDLPARRCLKAACDDLWAMPHPTEKHTPLHFLERDAGRTALLTNEPHAVGILTSASPYVEIQPFSATQIRAFRDAVDCESKVIALNWNGDTEISPEAAQTVLPAELRDVCASLPRDSAGTTPWQRFCRKAQAIRHTEGGVTTWVLCAPSGRHLEQLLNEWVKLSTQEDITTLPLCDLSDAPPMAVAAHIAGQDIDGQQIVPQAQMEETVRQVLGQDVRSVAATRNWYGLLEQGLADDPESASPFKDAQTAQRIRKASNAQVLLLLWITDLTPTVSHEFAHKRVTAEEEPPFTEPEPAEPPKPDPNEKVIFKGHKYVGGEKNKQYQKDLAQWRYVDHPEWERKHERWQRRKEEVDEKRADHVVEWNWIARAVPKMSLSGYLALIDAPSQRPIWRCKVEGSAVGEAKTSTASVRVRGDDREPPRASEFDELKDEDTWKGCVAATDSAAMCGVTRTALLESLKNGLSNLRAVALWAGDLKPWNVAQAPKPKPAVSTSGSKGEGTTGSRKDHSTRGQRHVR